MSLAHEPPIHDTAVVTSLGFNSNLSGATSSFGQFLALGSFPSSVLPWIFVWPMGSLPTYFAAKEMAESVELAKQLRNLIDEIMEQGFTRISIIGKSTPLKMCRRLSRAR